MNKILRAVRMAETDAVTTKEAISAPGYTGYVDRSKFGVLHSSHVAAGAAGFSQADCRHQKRSKLQIPTRLRPSESEQCEKFDEVLITLNASQAGLYLMAGPNRYRQGMSLLVEFPHSDSSTPLNNKYTARVVRVDPLENSGAGIAIQLLGPQKPPTP